MRDALDDDDPAGIARIVAEGALLPISAASQFELAVAIRLAAAIDCALREREPDGWRLERTLVISGRADMFAFLANGQALRLYYNQSVLLPGAIEQGSRHYLRARGACVRIWLRAWSGG
jgi:hypothetical protein